MARAWWRSAAAAGSRRSAAEHYRTAADAYSGRSIASALLKNRRRVRPRSGRLAISLVDIHRTQMARWDCGA
jgi:hypothetical protein